MRRCPTFLGLILLGVLSSPCSAGPILGTISLEPATVDGDLRRFDVSLTYTGGESFQFGYFALDVTLSDPSLITSVDPYSNFSFSLDSPFGEWIPLPPFPGRLEYSSPLPPVTLTQDQTIKLGELVVKLAPLMGNEDPNSEVSLAKVLGDPQFPSLPPLGGTGIGGVLASNLNPDFYQVDFDPDSQPINPAAPDPDPDPGVVVPEPSSLVLLVTAGLTGLVFRRRRAGKANP